MLRLTAKFKPHLRGSIPPVGERCLVLQDTRNPRTSHNVNVDDIHPRPLISMLMPKQNPQFRKMFFREVVPCVANIEIRGKGKGGNAQTPRPAARGFGTGEGERGKRTNAPTSR